MKLGDKMAVMPRRSNMGRISSFDRDEIQAERLRLSQEVSGFRSPDENAHFPSMSPLGKFVSNKALETVHNPTSELGRDAFVEAIKPFDVPKKHISRWFLRYKRLIVQYRSDE